MVHVRIGKDDSEYSNLRRADSGTQQEERDPEAFLEHPQIGSSTTPPSHDPARIGGIQRVASGC